MPFGAIGCEIKLANFNLSLYVSFSLFDSCESPSMLMILQNYSQLNEIKRIRIEVCNGKEYCLKINSSSPRTSSKNWIQFNLLTYFESLISKQR